MEGKYFFNNKDITMNLCIQIRDVIDIIKERSHLSFQDAAGAFYHSKTYQALQKYREYALGGVSGLYRRPVLRRTGTKRITDKLKI